MYNRILVAFDGSEGSQAALKHADQVAVQHHAELFIVHAAKDKRVVSSRPMYALPYGSGDTGGYLGTPTVEAPEEAVQKRDANASVLDRAKKQVTVPKSKLHIKLLHGDPAKEICEFASMNEISLIIIGNRGLHGVRKLMLGSVSQKVAQQATCPVLIVK